MFSRVQEITPGKKEIETDEVVLPADPEKPVEKNQQKIEIQKAEVKAPKKNRRQPAQSQAESPATVQRQVDLPVVKKQSKEIAQEPDQEPVAEVMGSVPVPELPIEKPPEDEFVEVTKPTPDILEGDVPVKKKALPVKKKPDYKPVFQPAIRKALPVKKGTDAGNRSAGKTARPVVQPTVQREKAGRGQQLSIPRLKTATEKPAAAVRASQQSSLEEVTREEKTQPLREIVASPKNEEPVKAGVREIPVKRQEQDENVEQFAESDPVIPELATPNFVQEDTSQEMPLRLVLAKRQKAAVSVIRRAEPVKLKQGQKPTLTHVAGHMIASQKTNSHIISRAISEMPAVRQDQPAFRPGGPQTISSRISTPRADFQPFATEEQETEQSLLDMPVAGRETVVPQEKAAEKQETKAQANQQLAYKPLAAPAIARATNVVQRQWEEHSGVEGQGSGGASSQRADGNGEDSPLDLEALAEDVFPYVKRILEIESNRISGSLR